MIIIGSICLAILFLNLVIEFLKWISFVHLISVYEKKIVIDAYQSPMFTQSPLQPDEEEKDESENQCES